MIDDRTPRGWPLPHPENRLDLDVSRLRDALGLMDAAITQTNDRVADLESRSDARDAESRKKAFEEFIGLWE